MPFELHPEIIDELGSEEDLDIQEILANPESAFVHESLSPEQKEEALSFHAAIIANPELFIGSGNDGVVFDLPSKSGKNDTCIKNIWEDISVEMKGKRFELLPAKLQELRKIQDYFGRVKDKKRAASKKGLSYDASNSPAVEAGLQIAARALLKEAGYADAVPGVKSLLRIESKGDGDVDGSPYAFSEVADLIIMDKVPGKSVQDFILGYEHHTDIVEKLDPEVFRTTLKAMMQVLHDNNLTHQDITKRNIMINFETLLPVIIDFGKASAGYGSFSKDQEMEYIEEVCRTLTMFKNSPKEAQTLLKTQLGVAF